MNEVGDPDNTQYRPVLRHHWKMDHSFISDGVNFPVHAVVCGLVGVTVQ